MALEKKIAPSLQPRLAIWAGRAALMTVSVILVIKSWAWAVSGSASVLAMLIDSLSDAGMSLIMLLSIHYALKPADKNHRHGHGKIEGLAAFFQGAWLIGLGVFLGLESLRRLARPEPVTEQGAAVVVLLLSVILTVMLVTIQNYVLRRAPSLAVRADREHYSADIFLNGGAILAILAVYFGAPYWVDPAFALAISGWVVRSAVGIGKKGLDVLLDRELPKSTRTRIKQLIMSQPRVAGFHDLRTRSAGMHMHISFDIEMDADLRLYDAHDIARQVEEALLQEFPEAEIMIHIDPLGDTADSRHKVPGVHH